MVALGVATTVTWHRRARSAELHFPAHPAQRGDASIDFADFVDVDAPSLPHDLAMVRDLSARLSVKRCLAQDEGDAIIGEIALGDDDGVDIVGVGAGDRWAVGVL